MSLLSTKRNKYLGATLALAFLLTLVVMAPRLLDPLLIEKDFRNFYLVFRLQDPALFPGQALTELELASPAYTLLLWGGGLLMSPPLFSKLLVFPLLLASVYCVFRIGERLRSPGAAVGMALGFAVFNLATNTEVAVTAGVQRSFAVPLLLAVLYALMEVRRQAAVAIVLLSGLIYLPILPVVGLTTVLCLALRRDESGWRLTLTRRQLLFLTLAVVIILVAVSPFLMTTVLERLTDGLQAMREGRHLLVDPYYRPGGRMPIFVMFPITGRAGLVSGASTFMQLLLLGALAVLVYGVRREKRRSLPLPMQRMFAASLIAFGLSWIGILVTSTFIFYLPSRHTEAPLFVLLAIFVFLNIDETIEDLAGLVQLHRRRLATLALPVLLLAAVAAVVPGLAEDQAASDGESWRILRQVLLALILFLLPLLWLVRRRRAPAQGSTAAEEIDLSHVWIVLGAGLLLLAPVYIRAAGPASYKPAQSDLQLHDYLSTLPADVTIAGDPCSLDDVHYYARRNVLYSCWRFDHDGEAVMAGLDAYYAEEPEQVLDFCRAYDVDVLVVDEETLSPDYLAERAVFYEPFAGQLAPRLEGRSNFALARVPLAKRLFHNGKKYVVECLERQLETP